MAQGPRRRTAWDDEWITETIASGGVGTSLLVQNVADPEKRGCTLVRLIVDMVFTPVTPLQSSGVQWIQFGIGLTSDDAFTAAATPEPEAEADFPVQGWILRSHSVLVSETSPGPGMVERRFYDLRVSRKLERSSVFVSVTNTAIEGSALAVRHNGLFRALYKLP